jgi:UDP-N-acetylmuramate dehydrogenase
MNSNGHLLSRLPAVRGRLRADAPLAQQTWFRVGGNAEVLFRPADEADLAEFLAGCPADIPVQIIGVASNLIIRDGGLPGVTIKLGSEFARVETDGETITAGAATLDTTIAQHAAAESLGGLEFLSGIPGAIGGALRMNAGAYGSEIKDILISASAVDRQGKIHTVRAADLNLTYRHSGAPADWIFTGATFMAHRASESDIMAHMDEIKAARESTQPVRSRTGGSTFANPYGHKAWQLIDAAGCRGLRVGGAQVSELHCNFLLNTGDATAADLENLGEEVRARVQRHSGIDLRWEIQRIGERAATPARKAA